MKKVMITFGLAGLGLTTAFAMGGWGMVQHPMHYGPMYHMGYHRSYHMGPMGTVNPGFDPLQVRNIMFQLQEKYPDLFDEFRDKMLALRNQLFNATPDEAIAIRQKMWNLRQQFLQELANKLPADQKNILEQMIQTRANIYNNITSSASFANVSTLPSVVKTKIDTVLENKLFSRLPRLSETDQKALLEKVLTRVTTLLNKARTDTNDSAANLKIAVLTYIKNKIQSKLN